MATPGTCSICKRADADTIDQALAVEGLPVRVTARRFGLGRSAVGRHSKKCLSGRLRRAAEARSAGSDPSLLDRLRDLNRETLEILAEARKTKSQDLALAAIGRAERQLELEGRLLGQIRDGDLNVFVGGAPLTDEDRLAIARQVIQRHSKAIDTTAALLPRPTAAGSES
jgi:hypothetical protein